MGVTKPRMIEHFLGEYVLIVMNIKQTASMSEEGFPVNLPVAFEGVLTDFDAKFVMLSPDKEPEKLLSLSKIVSIEIVKPFDALDELLSKAGNDGPAN